MHTFIVRTMDASIKVSFLYVQVLLIVAACDLSTKDKKGKVEPVAEVDQTMKHRLPYKH